MPPLCQYSADDGHLTAWHMAHREFVFCCSRTTAHLLLNLLVGGIFTRGPGLTFIEATAVSPVGRISPGDAGLWSDSQIEPIRKITEFAHLQGQKVGIQLAHAGRKASMVAPWLNAAKAATKQDGGWPDRVVGPTGEPYSGDYNKPRALSTAEVQSIVQEWVEAGRRAVEAGIDVIEIHAAHGFLLFSFLSPVTNKRTDRYGGSFENRARLLLEVVDGVRAAIPETMPLFVR